MLLLFQSGIVFKMLNDPEDPRKNPSNFDINKDNEISRQEYEMPICQHSFDSTPLDFAEIEWETIKRDNTESPIDLDDFSEWWMTNHSDVAHALMRISIACIVLTIVVGFYAEVRIISIIQGRADDGGISALHKQFKGQLDEMLAEFTRHMTDIHNAAKKSIEEDDDLDVFSQALYGVMQLGDMFADHRKVMYRIAVQTFLEISSEPVEAASWPGALNLYEEDLVDEKAEETIRNLEASGASKLEINVNRHWQLVRTHVWTLAHFREFGNVTRCRREKVRSGWEHWERDAFDARNLKVAEEWVSRAGGYFKQGPLMIDIDAAEDAVSNAASSNGLIA
jgi:hypothetical protein